jgi:hypothetical protein
VAVDGEDFGEKVGRVDETRDKDKAEEVLACPLLKPIETHADRLELLRSHRRSCKADCTFVVDELLGWPRLVRVSVSSTNTCPPPKAAEYSASATNAPPRECAGRRRGGERCG